MSLQTDIARDWEIFDGVEDATLTAKSARLPDVVCANVKVLRRALNKSAMSRFAGVLFDPNDILIEVWDYRETGSTTVQTAISREIEPDDLLTFTSGKVYRIANAMYSHMTSRWSCRCHRVIEE